MQDNIVDDILRESRTASTATGEMK